MIEYVNKKGKATSKRAISYFDARFLQKNSQKERAKYSLTFLG